MAVKKIKYAIKYASSQLLLHALSFWKYWNLTVSIDSDFSDKEKKVYANDVCYSNTI